LWEGQVLYFCVLPGQSVPHSLCQAHPFHDDANFVGQVADVTLTKLTRKMGNYQGGD
jgi:phage tail tube protein FII